MPIIMAGLKIAMSLALAGAIVGEFLSANQGMAVLIHRYTYSLNMASSFAVLLSLTALGFVLFKIAEFADSRIDLLEPRRPHGRGRAQARSRVAAEARRMSVTAAAAAGRREGRRRRRGQASGASSRILRSSPWSSAAGSCSA